MKLYTKTGDKGQTDLIGGRVSKSSLRVDVYGNIDESVSLMAEINSLLECEPKLEDVYDDFSRLIHIIFDTGHDFALVSSTEYYITELHVSLIEKLIDSYQEKAPGFDGFIIPGGSLISAKINVLRTVIRRCERLATKLNEVEPVNENALVYLNRLSDFFFIAARYVNKNLGVKEVYYQSRTNL